MKGQNNMMKFRNVETLSPKEKVTNISIEILNEYPEIGTDLSIKIAALCDPVDDVVDEDVIFKRYYYILWKLGKSHPLFDKVLRDMKNLCAGSLKDEINKSLYEEIIKYDNNEISNFPSISDYYG